MTLRTLCAAVLAAICSAAGAVPITSPADPALTGASLIDFNTTPPGSYVSLTVQGVTMRTTSTAGDILYVVRTSAPGDPIENVLTNYRAVFGFDFRFAAPVSAFAFQVLGGLSAPASVTAYDAADNVIDSFVSPVLSTYAGLAEGAPVISRLVFDPLRGVSIDNLSVAIGSVPEPGTAALFGLGLAALASTRRVRGRGRVLS